MQYQHEIMQYNTINEKLSNSQLNKLKSGIKNGIEIILNPSSKVINDSNDWTNFPYKSSLTDTQVLKLLQIAHKLIQNYQNLNFLRWWISFGSFKFCCGIIYE